MVGCLANLLPSFGTSGATFILLKGFVEELIPRLVNHVQGVIHYFAWVTRITVVRPTAAATSSGQYLITTAVILNIARWILRMSRATSPVATPLSLFRFLLLLLYHLLFQLKSFLER